MTPDTIRRTILETVAQAQQRMTPHHLVRAVCRDLGLSPPAVRSQIEHLVHVAKLAYRYELGASFIERSFERPVRLGQHIVVTPPPGPKTVSPGDVVIKIAPGAAFGTGRHPTTRLCILGLEYVARIGTLPSNQTGPTILDIGTGSGILLMAASRLQLGSGLGIDIDPCARSEARKNVALNQLEGAIEIGATPLDGLHHTRFNLIIANLRYPTLKSMVPWFGEHSPGGGLLVLSGIKVDERVALERNLGQAHFYSIWHRTDKDWAAEIFRKQAREP